MIKRLALATLTLAAGALALWSAFHVSGEIRDKRDWPTIAGTIFERGVGEPMGTRGRSFLPRVKYRYTVDGKGYVGDQVYLIRQTGDAADAIQRLVDGLPDPVPVHYNPANPADSYLIVNPRGTFWILVAFGVGALIFGLLQLLVVVTKKAPSGVPPRSEGNIT